MKNKVKLLLLICSAILSICAIALGYHIWQGTPFFDMRLVFVDAVIVLLTAALLAIAMLSSSD